MSRFPHYLEFKQKMLKKRPAIELDPMMGEAEEIEGISLSQKILANGEPEVRN